MPHLRFLLIILLLTSFACRPKKETPPAGLLSKEQMTYILIHKHLLEADLEFRQLQPDSANYYFSREFDKILNDREIDEERYRRSYDFYLRNPHYMDAIYATVVDSLSLREALSTQRETGVTD